MTRARFRTTVLLHLGEAVEANHCDGRTPEMRHLEAYGQLLNQEPSAGQVSYQAGLWQGTAGVRNDEANRKLVGGLSAQNMASMNQTSSDEAIL